MDAFDHHAVFLGRDISAGRLSTSLLQRALETLAAEHQSLLEETVALGSREHSDDQRSFHATTFLEKLRKHVAVEEAVVRAAGRASLIDPSAGELDALRDERRAFVEAVEALRDLRTSEPAILGSFASKASGLARSHGRGHEELFRLAAEAALAPC